MIRDPCQPSPCGQFAQCRDIGGAPSCSCLSGYIGSPPNCRPECVINSECASNKACMREKCRDPCPGSCGQNAQCNVFNHVPMCTCIQGYVGDPFTACNPAPPPPRTFNQNLLQVHKIKNICVPVGEPVVTDPCNPSPCGPNAQCRNGQCSCLPEFQGDPYQGCRPECVQSTDCTRDKACMQRKCRDPCPGTCGQSAVCVVSNHIPMCSCPSGMQGDPFVACRPVPGKINLIL